MSKNTRTRLCSHTRNKHSVPFSSAFVVSHAGVVLLLLVVVLSCSRPRANDTCCNLFPSTKVSQKVSIKKTAIKASRVFDDDTRARSQIVVERNDDNQKDSTHADDDYSLAFSSKGEREREDGIARKTQKKIRFY
jgi:hypothetical protein